ncbi:hypothetical protein L6164_036566 [Bauhinia variegata]|uniref:Uncharacterized protein n=1 Tax=Bauhinia variegata TaxID=167791 RepID=A0ACB9KHC2_BAUVA|nr:hypothetical protein L6164_036566 [Bauhinia variegata]
MEGVRPSFILITCLTILISVSPATSDLSLGNFLQCLQNNSEATNPISAAIFLSSNPSFPSLLLARIYNRRYSTPTTPKPLAIVAAKHESHVQATVICAKSHGMQIRIRSGGYDYEGLSYVSKVPFVVLDMFNLHSVDVSVADGTDGFNLEQQLESFTLALPRKALSMVSQLGSPLQ